MMFGGILFVGFLVWLIWLIINLVFALAERDVMEARRRRRHTGR